MFLVLPTYPFNSPLPLLTANSPSRGPSPLRSKKGRINGDGMERNECKRWRLGEEIKKNNVMGDDVMYQKAGINKCVD